MLAEKRILLIFGGGIAAYKGLELIRSLRKEGASVVPVLTRAAQEFVTPLTVSALAGQKVYRDLFDLTDEAEMGHIELSRAADLVVVLPATADLMAKMAQGHANDLASTLLMATDKPVMIVPAMNVKMWEHPATQRNLATLKSDGIKVCGPVEGAMACGEFGFGRMSEVDDVLEQITAHFKAGPLKGRHVLVTSGPTHEPIDPVRYIANRSSGAQGSAIAKALAAQGAQVTFITGPAKAARPEGAKIVEVETAVQMMQAVSDAPKADAAIFAAAVADWAVENVSNTKMKKTKQGIPELNFTENPDILKTVSQWPAEKRPQLVIGFAAETCDVIENATAKRLRKGCDWIVANDVRPETGIMGGDENAIVLISEQGASEWPRMSKNAAADRLVIALAQHLGGAQ